MSGKGSRPRPFSVNQETFDSNWDRIFSKKESWDHYSDLPSPQAYSDDKSTKEEQAVNEISKLVAEITLDDTELDDPERIGN